MAERRQIEGIDTYNFPADLLGHPLLAWMGADYVRFVALELLQRFRKQDGGTEMLAIKCEQRTGLLTSADSQTGAVYSVIAEFVLQVLLRAPDGRCWRLRGDGRFTATGLDQPAQASLSVAFDIHSTEDTM